MNAWKGVRVEVHSNAVCADRESNRAYYDSSPTDEGWNSLASRVTGTASSTLRGGGGLQKCGNSE